MIFSEGNTINEDYTHLNPHAKPFIPRTNMISSETFLERWYHSFILNALRNSKLLSLWRTPPVAILNPKAKTFYPNFYSHTLYPPIAEISRYVPKHNLNPYANSFFPNFTLNPNAETFHPNALVHTINNINRAQPYQNQCLALPNPIVFENSFETSPFRSTQGFRVVTTPDFNEIHISVCDTSPSVVSVATPDLSECCSSDNGAHTLGYSEPEANCTPMRTHLAIGDDKIEIMPGRDEGPTSCENRLLTGNDTESVISETSTFNSSMDHPNMDQEKNDEYNPFKILKSIRVSHINRLILGQLNINSLRNKFEALKSIVSGNLDILVITESKLDDSFPKQQFFMEGFSPPFRLDRNANGGGVLIYVREDITCKELRDHSPQMNIEGIFLELNLKRSKWLLFGGYNPNKDNIVNFCKGVGPILDHYMPNYDNFVLLGDFNSEMRENVMKEFCDTYNLYNLIKESTCFKNPLNPSLIDLILTNRPRSFQNSVAVETGLSDHHKLTLTVMRAFFPKQTPVTISYRDYKHFDPALFRHELLQELNNTNDGAINYDIFENICIGLINRHAPLKVKYIRANNMPFMNKKLSKAVMTRSRLRNKFLKIPSDENRANYTKYRNYCTRLFRKEKKLYYNNLDMKLLTDNKKFWKTVKPFFSDKHFSNNKITLLENEEIISDDTEVAQKFNKYFTNVVKSLNIEGFQTDYCYNTKLDNISNIIEKFKTHPSIYKIKENVKIETQFHFMDVSDDKIKEKIFSLNKKKPTTFNNIPTRILVENCDIISPFITDIYNESKTKSDFPVSLKLADITPAHKKDDRTIMDNYRPVSILPSVSKIFERNMYEQISQYVDKYLSPFLFGFRKGYCTQHCLMVMLEKWKTAMDRGNMAGALLTDLSKAFDCLNHELLIAKLEAYGFDHESLTYIYSYLSERKQRTKVNKSFSEWDDISTGVPQGSILGPLLFNIYLNDIFYFVQESNLANYADDTTPYTINITIEPLLRCLYNDTMILIKWFKVNYLQMNPDKCKLLISNKDKDISIIIDNEVIECSKSVKLLGITIDSKLDFSEHVSKLCKKVSSKLHALARISNFMSQDKLRLLMKSFIESQFSYCPLIWMFHSRTLNNRINRLHERGLRLVYKDSQLTFEELLRKDNSFTIHHRNLQKLAIEMYKAYNDLSPCSVKSIFPERVLPYDLRNKNPFRSTNARTVFNGTETISFRGPKIWALVPDDIKSSKSVIEFKNKISKWEPKGCTCRLCKTFISNLGFL